MTPTDSSGKAREFWITQGKYGENFAKDEYLDFNMAEPLPASETPYHDDFYSMVVPRPFKNGIHVIEYSAYEKLAQELELKQKGFEMAFNQAIENGQRLIEWREQCEKLAEALSYIFDLYNSHASPTCRITDNALGQFQAFKKEQK